MHSLYKRDPADTRRWQGLMAPGHEGGLARDGEPHPPSGDCQRSIRPPGEHGRASSKQTHSVGATGRAPWGEPWGVGVPVTAV